MERSERLCALSTFLTPHNDLLDLETPLQFVKGIGPVRGEMLAAKGLRVISDLLYYAPFRYEDRRNIKQINELAPGEKAVVLARIESAKLAKFRGNARGLFEALFEDGSGAKLLGRWYHGERFADGLVSGTHVALFGKIDLDRATGRRLMTQPEVEVLTHEDDSEEALHSGRIVAVYEAASKISARILRGIIHRVLRQVELPKDELPESVRERLHLPELGCALKELHEPGQDADVQLWNEYRAPAQQRLIFDEFFWLECGLALKKTKARMAEGIPFQITENTRSQLKQMLPFKPTGAQKRVMQEIVNDMKVPHPMHRLLQGDVGSGKTIVAAQAAVIAVENGLQVAVLAPTEILANQHYSSFKKLLEPLGYVVVGLTGSRANREKEKLKELMRRGLAQVAVGTHALIQDDVGFARLGLAIIDEQHRFGVVQRLKLFEKGKQPDVLVMTATPIPRTLALTIYGDLDVSVIDELPPGRKPIVTKHVRESAIQGVYQFLRQQIGEGRQAYVVYPVVEESETAAVKAAETMYRTLSDEVFPELSIGLLHGKLGAAEKDAAMNRFKAGDTKILVATTVIEVGVDVPNATVMVIEQAERFGLAQTHQLRGRVGRGVHQSYCVLVTGKLNDVAKERIRTLVDSNDGFYISEMDMRLRGSGEFYGTKQSGVPGLRLADLLRDADLLEMAREEAQAFLARVEAVGEIREAVRYIQDHWQRKYGLVQVG